jgi:hypothetical protein
MARKRSYRESANLERPPAYQEYAAVALTAESVRLMTAAERGLFTSMRWYCWTNDSVPADPERMARALSLGENEVRANLSETVLSFFEPAEDDSSRLVCPALVRQMDRLLHRREAQAQAGRDTARARREKKFQELANRDGKRDAEHHALEYSTAQQSPNQLGKGADQENHPKGNGPDPTFLADLQAGETAIASRLKHRPSGPRPRLLRGPKP